MLGFAFANLNQVDNLLTLNFFSNFETSNAAYLEISSYVGQTLNPRLSQHAFDISRDAFEGGLSLESSRADLR